MKRKMDMENISLVTLGKILKQRRKEKGFMQREVAEKIGTEQSIVSNWERGIRSPSFLDIYKLCQILDLTLDELLGIKKQHVTFTVNRETLEKLRVTLREYEEAIDFIFPVQDTKLHHKWTELKQLFEVLLMSAE